MRASRRQHRASTTSSTRCFRALRWLNSATTGRRAKFRAGRSVPGRRAVVGRPAEAVALLRRAARGARDRGRGRDEGCGGGGARARGRGGRAARGPARRPSRSACRSVLRARRAVPSPRGAAAADASSARRRGSWAAGACAAAASSFSSWLMTFCCSVARVLC